MRFEFEGEMWLFDGPDPWHFVTVPVEISDAIGDFGGRSSSRFGSVRVVANIGETTWSTSVFPDKETGVFQLPVKALVRQTEGLTAGDTVIVQIDVAS